MNESGKHFGSEEAAADKSPPLDDRRLARERD